MYFYLKTLFLILFFYQLQSGHSSLLSYLRHKVNSWSEKISSSLTPTLFDTELSDPGDFTVDMKDYISIIRNTNFFGDWWSLDTSNLPFNEFTSSHGVAMVETLDSQLAQPTGFNFTPITSQPSINGLGIDPRMDAWDIVIKLYDGNYVDQGSAELYYTVTSTNEITADTANATLKIPQSMMELYLSGDSNSFSCPCNVSIYIIDLTTGEPYTTASMDMENIGVQYELHSEKCSLQIITSILTYEPVVTTEGVLILGSIMTVLGLIQILGTWRFMKSLNKKRSIHHVSLGSLWLIASCDYYLLIVNLVMIFAFSAIFIVPLVIYLFLTFHYERELIMQVLQGRTKRGDGEISDEDCKSCGLSFAISAILFVLELVFILMAKIWVIQLTAFVLLPQIIHNCMRGKPYRPNTWHVCVLGLSRFFFVLYAKLYPENLYKLSPDPIFIMVYASILLIQLIILLIQMKYPRFCFSHDMKKKLTKSLTVEDLCPICFEPLKYVESSSYVCSMATTHESLVLPLYKPKPLIETPCKHVFHTPCLIEWVKTKPLCPMCRQNIQDTIEELESANESA